MFEQAAFEVALQHVGAYGKEIKVVRIFDDLLG
jgi:hypothetical protein